MKRYEHAESIIHEPIASRNPHIRSERNPVLSAKRPSRTITLRVSQGIPSERAGNPIWTIDYIQRQRKIKWGEVPSIVLREILTRAAEEISEAKGINLPATLLTSNELSHTTFRVTNSTLDGLYKYFAMHSEGNVIGAIMEAAGIEHEVTDIKIAKELGRDIQWDTWSNKALNKLFTAVAEDENVKRPASLLEHQDLNREFEFLGGNLDTLYQYALKTKSPDEVDPLKQLLEAVGHSVTKDDCRFAFTNGRPINWNRIRGKPLGEFLDDAASEIGIPLIFWSMREFSEPFQLIGGKNFYNLYGIIQKGDKDFIRFLLEFSDKELTPLQLFTHINRHPQLWEMLPSETKASLLQYAGDIQTLPELIIALEANAIVWKSISPELVRQALERLAAERGVPPIKLSHYNFRQPASFLNGHNLNGLFEFIAQGLEDPQPNQSAIVQALLDYAGISTSFPATEPRTSSEVNSHAKAALTTSEIIQRIRQANLTTISIELYLQIASMRLQNKATNEIARTFGLTRGQLDLYIRQLQMAKILTK